MGSIAVVAPVPGRVARPPAALVSPVECGGNVPRSASGGKEEIVTEDLPTVVPAQPVRIVGIELPFGDVAVLVFKVSITLIPLGIVVGIVWVCAVVVMSLLHGLLGTPIIKH